MADWLAWVCRGLHESNKALPLVHRIRECDFFLLWNVEGPKKIQGARQGKDGDGEAVS